MKTGRQAATISPSAATRWLDWPSVRLRYPGMRGSGDAEVSVRLHLRLPLSLAEFVGTQTSVGGPALAIAHVGAEPHPRGS